MKLLNSAAMALAITAASLGLASTAMARTSDHVAALQLAKLDLNQAIQAAQTQHGLKVIDIELDHKKQQAVYEIKGATAQGEKVKLKLNAADGQVVEQKPDGKLDAKDNERLAAAKISLSDAVAAATKAQPGRPFEAELSQHLGTVSYSVKLITADNKEAKVRVNAADGSILPEHTRAKQ